MKTQISGLTSVLALAAIAFCGPVIAQSAVTMPFVTQQPANEWLAGAFIDQSVQNTAGETIGEITDLIFDRQGKISTAVIGVGGFLGLGERNVGVPFGSLTFKVGAKDERIIVLAVTKETLLKAPEFKATEKSLLQRVKEGAVVMGQKTVEKAVELKDQAGKKIEDMRKGDPAKK